MTKCLWCRKRKATHPNGACGECDAIDDFLAFAAQRAEAIGLKCETFWQMLETRAATHWTR